MFVHPDTDTILYFYCVKNDSATVNMLNCSLHSTSVGLTICVNNFRILHAMNIILLLLKKTTLSSGGLYLGLFSSQV